MENKQNNIKYSLNCSYKNRDYEYEKGITYLIRDENNKPYLIRDGKVIALGNITFYHENGDQQHTDHSGIRHLIRNGKVIASGINVFSYNNGDYEYEDEDEEGIRHLIRDGKVIASGKFVYSFANLDYKYTDKNGVLHRFDKNHKEIKNGK